MICMVEIAGKGGICHYSYNLCNALATKKQVILITAKTYELENLKRNFKLMKVFNRFRTNPFDIFKMVIFCLKEKPKIIHFQLSQHPEFVLLLVIFLKMFKMKIILTAHNVVSHEDNLFLRYIFKILYKISDKIIVHANCNKKELQKFARIPLSKITVILHGNYFFFKEVNSALENYPNVYQCKNILFFGYIRQYKGLIYLIRALKEIKKVIPNVKLIIAGKPVEDFYIYKREIDKLNIKDNVLLDLGYISFKKIYKYFKIANVVVLPYTKIYQSGILQLAYAFKKPVVVTNVGGLTEVVEHGKNGFVVPPKDVNSLANAIIQILKDENLAKKMGEYGYYLAKTKYSWETIALKTLNTYKSIY